MNTVFIGGSRKLSRVNSEIARRLDNIVEKNLKVVVGDASGFDRAAQEYLADRQYPNVVVYCTGGKCRNNVGEWPRQDVDFSGPARGFAFYAAKDDAMLRDADYGLFAWDGVSRGTLRNILNMARHGKRSVVYYSPAKRFVTVATGEDAADLARTAGQESAVADSFFGEPAIGSEGGHGS